MRSNAERLTPLRVAAAHRRLDSARVLVAELGALDAATRDDGFKALHLAALQNDLPMCQILAEAGAVEERNAAGQTALDLSTRRDLTAFLLDRQHPVRNLYYWGQHSIKTWLASAAY